MKPKAIVIICAVVNDYRMFIAMGNEKKALALLRRYYHEKYNRHSAFRREVKSVVAGSALLRGCGFL